MATIVQMTFSNAFSRMKMHELQLKFHWSFVPKGPINYIPVLGLDNGLVPTKRQAIIWTNDGYQCIYHSASMS